VWPGEFVGQRRQPIDERYRESRGADSKFNIGSS
jgi:hypothetical protein